MEQKKRVKKAAITLVVIALLGIVVSSLWEHYLHARITGPEIRQLEMLLKEQSESVSCLRVHVSRPTAHFDVCVRDARSDDLFELMKTIADYINREQLYKNVLMPEFRSPFIWADGIKITFYEGWGCFARTLQEYDCLHYVSYGQDHYESYEEIAQCGFLQWQIRLDALNPDRELRQVVYECSAP